MSTLWVLLDVKVIEEEPFGFWTADINAEGNRSLSATKNINFLSSTRTNIFHQKYDFTLSYQKPTDVYPYYDDDWDYLEFRIAGVEVLPDGERPIGYDDNMISYTRERLEGYSWDANYTVYVKRITTELHETEIHAWQMATDIPSRYDGMSYVFNNYYGSDNVTITLYLFNNISLNGLLDIKKSKFTDWILQNGSMDEIQKTLKFQEEKLGYKIVFTSGEEGSNSETLGFSYIDSIKSIVKNTANNVVSYYSNQGAELAWDDFKSTLLSEGESVVQNLVEKFGLSNFLSSVERVKTVYDAISKIQNDGLDIIDYAIRNFEHLDYQELDERVSQYFDGSMSTSIEALTDVIEAPDSGLTDDLKDLAHSIFKGFRLSNIIQQDDNDEDIVSQKMFTTQAFAHGQTMFKTEAFAHGQEMFIANAHDNNILIDGANNSLMIGAAKRDILLGGFGKDMLIGGESDDALFGGDGQDVLLAGSGNDFVNGNKGADWLYGGAGSDIYIVDNTNDIVSELDYKTNVSKTADPVFGSYIETSQTLLLTTKEGIVEENISTGETTILLRLDINTTLNPFDGSFGYETIRDRALHAHKKGDYLYYDYDDFSLGLSIFRINTVTNEKTTVVELSDNGVLEEGFYVIGQTDNQSVVFVSADGDLVENDTNDVHDIFMVDVENGDVTRISTNAQGEEADGESSHSAMSANLEWVVFQSQASNLVTNDNNGFQDIFLKSLQTNQVYLLSSSTQFGQANNNSSYAQISDDGSKVIFSSLASNLVENDTNQVVDIFLRDGLNPVTRISTSATGEQANKDSHFGSISADGRYAVFVSSATNLVEGDVNQSPDVFLKDLLTGDIRKVSSEEDGIVSISEQGIPRFSQDGKTISYGVESGFDESGLELVKVVVKSLVLTDMGGVDLVRSSVSYVLPEHVENLTLIGSDNLTGTGNSLDNVITGNSGNNVLSGVVGNDTYLFNRSTESTGQDIIDDTDGLNTLSITGTSLAQLSAIQQANHLILAIQNSTDTITIKNFFDSNNQASYQLSLDGSVVLDKANLAALVPTTLIGADGGTTQIIYNPNQGTTQYAHTDINGQTDWQQTLNNDGSLVQIDHDQNHSQPWSSRTDTVNSNGALQSVVVINDNGSQDLLELNSNSNQPWQEQNRHYDAMGNLDYILTINNDGSMDWQDEDQDNSQTWRTVNSHQSPDGRLDWRRYINDNGTEDWLDLDQDNTQTWTQQATHKNTFGQDEHRSVLWDNGNLDIMLLDGSVRNPMVLDVANNYLWQQNTQHFDSSGVYTGSDILLDTGITANQVWLRQEGNNLEISLIGTDQKMLIADWFIGNAKTKFSIDAASGTLMANEVQTLVEAMAAFAPPATGQTTLPQNYQDELGTVIAASWS